MEKIIIDVMGADRPENVIEGALLADIGERELVFFGDEYVINAEISKVKPENIKITVVGTTEVVSNDEAPTSEIRTKKDSSMRRAFEMLKTDDEAVGLISAGSTGAVLTAGILILGRINGIDRPTLAPILPTLAGSWVVIADAGANVDCRPDWLFKFGLMGDAYCRALGIENPRIGLLNVGTEKHKGNLLTHETYPLLENAFPNFVGNVEARDALSGEYDVIVADGFDGNILVKASEGTAKMFSSLLKKEIKSNAIYSFGALFMKKAFKKLKSAMDYNSFGGAPLLGVKKPVVKAHGSCNAVAVKASVEQLLSMHTAGIIKSIEDKLSDTQKA